MRIYVECGYSLSNRMLSTNGNNKNVKKERGCLFYWISIYECQLRKCKFINLYSIKLNEINN